MYNETTCREEMVMNRQELRDEIRKLPAVERVCLVEEAWEDLDEEEQDSVLSPEQRKELRRRIENCKANPPPVYTWDEFVAKLKSSV